MRDAFPGYYPPTDEEETALWDDGLIVLDSSALLSLFRYSPQTRSDILHILTEKSAQLWIPHHVGVEFHRSRLKVMKDQDKAFDEIEDALREARNKIEAAVLKFKRHPSLSSADLNKQLKKSVGKLRRSLAEAKAEHDAFVGGDDGHDKTFDSITNLYEGRVGKRWDAGSLVALYKEGATRFENSLPPGYKDKFKGGEDQYGDLVIWRQILEHAKAASKSIIFVTDDLKEDWWRIVEGRRLGPRPELVDEFFAETGERVHFYSPERFLEVAKQRGAVIEDASLEEVEKVSQSATQWVDTARRLREISTLVSQSDFTASLRRALAQIDPEQLKAIQQAFAHNAALMKHPTLPRGGVAEAAARLAAEREEWPDVPYLEPYQSSIARELWRREKSLADAYADAEAETHSEETGAQEADDDA